MAWQGRARRGLARQGKAGQGKARFFVFFYKATIEKYG